MANKIDYATGYDVIVGEREFLPLVSGCSTWSDAIAVANTAERGLRITTERQLLMSDEHRKNGITSSYYMYALPIGSFALRKIRMDGKDVPGLWLQNY